MKWLINTANKLGFLNVFFLISLFFLVSFFINLGSEEIVFKLGLSFLLFVLFFIFYIFKKPEKSISYIVRSLIIGQGFGLYGVLGVIFFIVQVGWFGDTIIDNNLNSLDKLIQSAVIFINIFSFGIGFLLFYPERKTKKLRLYPEKRKILIMALSYNKDLNASKEILKNVINNNELDSFKSYINWLLPLRSLKYHSSKLEKAIFLVSQQSNQQWDEFVKLVEILDKKENIKLRDKIQKTRALDFNDHEDIIDELRILLKSIMRHGYKDEDISVNISGGTSAVTLSLTLFALEENRQIEYFTQFDLPAKLKVFNVNKDDALVFLKSLSLEE